ncbi:KTSC domain-containing protein [Modestobacter sp. VKM Ac-2985]|uniref:KTSC domain-containing protein n=1 Tax=Modestobacter sp. VKM Ac-2985 TaxID=3004139 RepID=UPI0022AB6BE6|nr:KTSC domain-containing protein [Modestobacter sp. VKM Ac-2985]MCZ2840064.1 KTSC domain-containing protein [Modestobacter sp. VKM Ac-2985]
MLRTAVQSSNIATVGYDEEQQLLELVFRDGRVYHFLEVPPERVLSLLRAESKGRFFNAEIKPNFGHRAVGRRWD